MPDQYGILEPKELRIGNILFHTEKGKYVHVTSLSMDIDDEYNPEIGVCEVGKNNNEFLAWERELAFAPVPLTPELLEKCGFERWRGDEFTPTWLLVGMPEIEHMLITIKYDGDRKRFYFERFFHKLEYLHQLQNLIHALTGTDLVVNL